MEYPEVSKSIILIFFNFMIVLIYQISQEVSVLADEIEAKKRDFIISALMLCLLDSWTVNGNPQRDLKLLGISVRQAMATIQGLIEKDLAFSSIINLGYMLDVMQIIKEPRYFHEAYVLTEKGREVKRDNNLDALKQRWLSYQGQGSE